METLDFVLQKYKREIETQLIRIQQREFDAFFNPQAGIDIKSLDFREYEAELMFHKAIAENNEIGGYQILFWGILPYRVPIAMQSAIALPKDMNGGSINDVFDLKETTRMQYLR